MRVAYGAHGLSYATLERGPPSTVQEDYDS